MKSAGRFLLRVAQTELRGKTTGNSGFWGSCPAGSQPRVPGTYGGCRYYAEGKESMKDSIMDAAKHTKEQLSPESKRLFGKVLEGQHVPPRQETPTVSTTTSGRVLSAVSNIMFYGTLSAALLFGGSYYAYTEKELEERVTQLQGGADATTQVEGGGTVGIQTQLAGAGAGEGGVQLGGGLDMISTVELFALENLRDARAWVTQKQNEMADPPTDNLLPPMHPFQVQHNIRTLVIDLDGVLVHSDWTRQVGWKTFKRPGATDLIDVLAQFYEIVVFTNESHTYADPILNRIDPGMISGEGHVIAYRLYKNATQYKDGEHCRDLSKLNRDPSKVLFITTKAREKTCLQPENMIVIDDWKNLDPADTTLLDLVPMLQLIVFRQVPDTRTVCQAYAGTDVISTFRERMNGVPGSGADTVAAPRRTLFSR